ncbi:hypothetical protein [Sciscionella sediminilitoris]|uniref:hypothetical protein n=1 Tax=Sciscionella sediminilitoris TaxID=1445613 RepID=UPI0004DF1360|nr:hypothetical protein [Sciscionella sp. SE31]
MPRLLPYADLVAVTVLREALGETVTVETQLDDRLLQRLPYVFAEVVGGTELDPAFASRPALSVISWAEGSKQAGADLAESVRVALWRAHLSQRTYAGASIARVRALSMPYEQRLDNQPSEVFRFVAQYELILRPATAH